jgi:hypothetical protein
LSCTNENIWEDIMPQDSLNEGKQALHSFNILMWDSKESQFNISTHTQVWIWKSLIVRTNAEGIIRISKITYRKTNKQLQTCTF